MKINKVVNVPKYGNMKIPIFEPGNVTHKSDMMFWLIFRGAIGCPLDWVQQGSAKWEGKVPFASCEQ